MKKVLSAVVVTLLFVAFIRVAFGHTSDLSLKDIYSEVAQTEFISADDVLVDIQVVKYNFETIGNAFSADWGESYIRYQVYDLSGGSGPGGAVDFIQDTSGEDVYSVIRHTEVKPSAPSNAWQAVLNGVQFITDVIKYIGNAFVSVGKVLLDVFLSILNFLYKVGKFMLSVFFT